MTTASDLDIRGGAKWRGRVALSLMVSVLLVSSLALAWFVDLSGWWKVSDSEFFEFRQQGSVLTFWSVFGTPEAEIPPATIVNDTVLFSLGEDTLVFVYANDTLRGHDPDGNPVMFVRAPGGPPWVPIRCGTITVDGQKPDWPPSFVVCDDPNNDASGAPSTEIDRLYMCHDDTCLYVCLELVGDASFPYRNDRYSINLKDETHEYSIEFWGYQELRFRDHNSGQETYLWGCAVSGKIIEGRVPLGLLNGMSRFSVHGGSEYWHSDSDRGFYDEIRLLGKMSSCTCGDVDGSGLTDISDILSFINWAFRGGPTPQESERGDVDCSGRMNLADIAYLVRFVFRSGPAPCADCP